MNKICIVKLRKRMGQAAEPEQSFGSRACDAGIVNELPVLACEQTGIQPMQAERDCSEKNNTGRGKQVTLTLTEQQMRDLGSNPHVMSRLSGEFTAGPRTIERNGAPLVIQFQFAATMPLQMLKTGEVMQMLRISKNYLGKVVREGKLKSYKVGKLRRFLLDDILSYLCENCSPTDFPGNSIKRRPIKGF
jgi:excisionase family DNA binding protein